MRYSIWFKKTSISFILILLLSPILANQVEAATNQWSTSGPEGGNVFAIAVDPATPATVYAGTNDSGVFKSTDGGSSWSAINTGLTAYNIASLAIDPATPSTVYAGTNDHGIFKSTDGGSSWSAINTGLTEAKIRTLAIDPVTPGTVYVGTDGGGVFKSTDGGGTWTAINTGLTNMNINILVIDPISPAILYAGTYLGGVFKSTDGGGNWTAINTGLTNLAIYDFAIDPASPSILYAGTGGRLFRSTDGGSNWINASTGMTNLDIRAVAVDPVTPTTLYAGNLLGDMYKSTNSGDNWTEINTGLTHSLVNKRTLAIDPTAPNTVYVGTTDGAFKTTDGGSSWSAINAGLEICAIGSLAIDPVTPSTVYAGATGGRVFKSTDGGSTWPLINIGLTFETVKTLAIDPAAPGTVYAGSSDGVFKSTDGGANWAAVNTGLTNTDVYVIAVDPATTDTVYAGTHGGGVFKSTDGGSTWSAINTGLANTFVYTLAVDPASPGTIYAGTDYGAFRSFDGGSTWSALNTGLTGTYLRAIVVDPSSPSTLYAGTDGGGVFKSTDSGSSWSAVNAGLPDLHVSVLAIDPATTSTLYAATDDGGLYRSTANCSEWSPLSAGLTNPKIEAIAVDPVTPSNLYTGTDGSGVFDYQDVFDVMVCSSGGQSDILRIDSTDNYVGGTFVITDNTGTRTVTDITIAEKGTIDAAADITNIRLFYDLDTSTPHDCAGESYQGTEPQFGSTDSDGFSSADGSASFSDSVSVSPTQTLCVYVVLDIGPGAGHNESLEIEIADPPGDIALSSGVVTPTSFVALRGTTATFDLSGFSYHKMITVDNTRVSSTSDLFNFPLLVRIENDNDLTTSAYGGHVSDAEGDDIIFVDSTKSTQLDHEVEMYDSTTGTLIAWVRIPILFYNTDTVVYLAYGNSSISVSQENIAGVWDSNFAGVWHLEESMVDENINGIHFDSTSNSNDGTQNRNVDTIGAIGRGQDFDGSISYDYINVLDHDSLNMGDAQDFTVSAWVKSSLAAISGRWPLIVGKELDGSSPRIGYNLSLHNEDFDSRWYFEIYDSGVNYKVFGSADVADGNWHYVVGVRNSADIMTFEDGDYTNNTIPASAGSLSKDVPLRIGASSHLNPISALIFEGSIDEVRISRIARSADWIKTEYNNQSDPASFYSLGAEQTDPAQVTGLAATAVPGQINLSWSAPSDGGNPIVGYRIERRTCSGSWSELVADTGTTGTSYADTSAVPSTCYGYRVAAINGVGTGAASTEATATADDAPGQVSGLTAAAVPGQIDLSWSAPADGGDPISGYQIERRTCAGSWAVLVADTGTTGTSYADTTAVAATCYGYRVSALNGVGTGTAAAEATATADDAPGQVSGLTAAAVPGQIDLSWSAPADGGDPISGYQIERRTCAGSWAVLVADTGTTGTSYADTTAVAATCYGYRVSALNGVGAGTAAAEATATADNVPGQVSGLTATAAVPGQIDLSWSAPSDGGDPISGYQIERRTCAGTWAVLVADTGTTGTSYADSTAVAATCYGYRVAALNGVGTGAASTEATATADAVPGQVAGLSATAVSGQIDLSWSAPSDGGDPISGYQIERRTCAGTWAMLVANTGTTGTGYSDTTVVPAACYGYRVAAINGVGTGAASGESTATAINLAPTADAGPDQIVDEAVTVTLDASNSSDPDNGIASYLWTQLSGTAVTLSDATAVQPTFTSPVVGVGGEALTFELTVTDNGGLQSTNTCIVNVTWSNLPPTADAGSDQTLGEGVLVTLDGSNSTDPDDGIASYLWTQLSGTAVTLSDTTAVQPTFTSPVVGVGGEALTFELTVTDNGSLQSTDTCIVNVTWSNLPPTADAGPDQTLDEGVVATLDGSNSTDPDDGIVVYQWTQVSGAAVTLSDATAIKPTFTAPQVDSGGDSLTFQLMVIDAGGLSATDTVSTTVNDLTAPDVPVIYPVAGTTDNQPTLDWDNAGDASTYEVEYDTDPGFGTAVVIPNITLSYYQIQTALGDGTWYWRVKAEDSAGNQSAWSSTGSFLVDTSAYCLLDPDQPVLLSPADGAGTVSLVPTLTGSPFVDPDACSTHEKTRWQISETVDFSLLAADIEATANYLTSFQVPVLILEPGTTYYWRVRYWGSSGNKSPWSSVFTFTTGPATNDANANGITDSQEVGAFVDLDGDSIFDNSQSDEIKSILMPAGGAMTGIRPLDSQIIRVAAVDSATLLDIGDTPIHVPYGLAAFRVEVTSLGDGTFVKLFLSEAVPASGSLVFYDPAQGWYDYSGYAVFNAARDEVTVQLKDGGAGDTDHAENGVIVGLNGIGFYANSLADRPIAVSPEHESVLSAGPATLMTGPFSDPEGDPHIATYWQVRRADRVYFCSDYDASFDHVGTIDPDLTEHPVNGLAPGLKYIWMAGYSDFGTANISWSQEYAFKVGASQAGDTLRIDPGTEVNNFRMVSFVQWPDDPAAESVFGVDALAVDYASNFKIGTYDPGTSSSQYIECRDGLKIEPGRAYWVLARNGLEVAVNGVPVSQIHDMEVKLRYNSSTGDGWNMIGCPNHAGYFWEDVEVLEYDANGNIVFGPTAVLLLPDVNPYVDKRLWRWENGLYYDDAIFMEPYDGYWVRAKKPGVFLRFPTGAQAMFSDPHTRLANFLYAGKRYLSVWPFTSRSAVAEDGETPPRPPAGFGSGSTGHDPLGNACFIDTIAAEFAP